MQTERKVYAHAFAHIEGNKNKNLSTHARTHARTHTNACTCAHMGMHTFLKKESAWICNALAHTDSEDVENTTVCIMDMFPHTMHTHVYADALI